jgi:hypothetical protein
MELTLTRSDLDAMPAELRHQLLLYLEGRLRSRSPRPKGSQAAETKTAESPLEQQHVAALLRDISFHRLGRPLRALLDRLAEDDAGSPLTRRKLAAALPAGEQPRLGRYIAMLNRLAAKAAKQPGLHLCRFVRGKGVYTIHPATRERLRELLPGIERAGDHEEPLWE